MNDFELLEQLCHALVRQDIGAVNSALAAGADPNGYRAFHIDRPPMNEAAARGFVKGLEALHTAGGLIDGLSDFETTPLMAAARNGWGEAGRWLIRQGADVRRKSSDHKEETAIEIAIDAGNLAVASMMLQERPDLRGEDLSCAARRIIETVRGINVVQWLLNAGISPDLVSEEGDPWIVKVQTFNEPLVGELTQLLLEAGANIDARNEHGRTALHRSVHLKSIPDFVRLVRAGANSDVPDNNNETVRKLLECPSFHQMDDFRLMREFLVGWEASRAAHQAIEASPTGASPL